MNDATSVVVFNVIQSFDFTNLNHGLAFQLVGNFSYLFLLSTLLGVAVSPIFFFFSTILSCGCLLICFYNLCDYSFLYVHMSSKTYILEGRYSYFLYICFPIWSKSTCPHMACLSHSTDREVALMMLMTYLSYMLAEVSFAFRYFFIAFKDKSTLMLIIILF